MNDEELNNYIKEISNRIPKKEFLDCEDLITLGIAKTGASLLRWRRKKKGPPFMTISDGKIRYPRNLFIEWLRKSITKTNERI